MSFEHSNYVMSFVKLFNNPSTSQRHFYNFGLKTYTIALMKLLIKIVNGIVGKHKKGEKTSEKILFVIVKFQTRSSVPIN